MKHLILALVFACLASLTVSPPSHAYGMGDESIVAKIDFDFTAGDQTLPAGSYRIAHQASEFPSIKIESTDGATSVPLLAVTRLARRLKGEAPDASLVFDKVGSHYFLSEIWLPDLDGFLVRATKETHEHRVVNMMQAR